MHCSPALSGAAHDPAEPQKAFLLTLILLTLRTRVGWLPFFNSYKYFQVLNRMHFISNLCAGMDCIPWGTGKPCIALL